MNENIVEELQQIEFDGDLEQILGADLMARLFAALAQQPASEPVGYTYTESLQDLKSCPSGTAFMLPVTDDAEGDMSEPVFIGPQPTPQVPDDYTADNLAEEVCDRLETILGRGIDGDGSPYSIAVDAVDFVVHAIKESGLQFDDEDNTFRQPSPQVPEGLIVLPRAWEPVIWAVEQCADRCDEGRNFSVVITDEVWREIAAAPSLAEEREYSQVEDQAMANYQRGWEDGYSSAGRVVKSVEQGREPIRCVDKLPSKVDRDIQGKLWAWGICPGKWVLEDWQYVADFGIEDGLSWMPTGLVRPEPPTTGDE